VRSQFWLSLAAAAIAGAFMAGWVPFEATVVWLLYFLVLIVGRAAENLDRG